MLLQLSQRESLPAEAREMMMAFLGEGAGDEGVDYEAPEANAYELQSGGIIELLQKLMDDLRRKTGQCEKENMIISGETPLDLDLGIPMNPPLCPAWAPEGPFTDAPRREAGPSRWQR